MPAAHDRLLRACLLGLAFGPLSLSCDANAGPPTPAAVAPAAVTPEPEPSSRPPAGNPLQDLAPADAGDDTFAGIVRESLPAGGYTYLRVATDGGDRWVATMGKGAPVGHRVHVKNMGTRHDFHSKRLGRRFDELAFGIVREA